MKRLVLDAGAFIALERRRDPMRERMTLALRAGAPVITHAGVVGQVWRGDARRIELVRALRTSRVMALDEPLGRAAGVLLAVSGTTDVIDAALVLLARPGDRLCTSDPSDIARLLDAARTRDVEVVAV